MELKVGDVFTLKAGKWECKYMVTETFFPVSITLRRCIRAKTKADYNRFNDIVEFKFYGNFVSKQTLNQ